MRRILLLIIPILFSLSINAQNGSASATCYTNILDPSTAFTVERTCFADIDCPSDSYCDYWSAFCLGLGGPCKPLDCKNCQVAQNHKCVFQFTSPPSWAPNCCSYSCSEGGLPNSYSASLYDQKCYDFKDVTNDVNNCGSCGNKCSSGYDCVSGKCKERLCKRCADDTRCSDCSSANPGKRCVDVGGAGLLQLDTSCKPYVPCTSCPEDGTAVGACNSAGQRCSEVSGSCILRTDTSCASGGTSCSSYNGDARNCNSAGGCYYCAVYGACLSAGDTSCPGYVDCSSYTSQSSCTWDGGTSSAKPACGWCPNSYNGGASQNGGTCYSASALASKCDSCFITGAYNIWSPSYCRDACPYAAPSNGYTSGWCTMGNVLSTGNENCAGNVFNTSVNSNGAVDCGECAINANGKDCVGCSITERKTITHIRLVLITQL